MNKYFLSLTILLLFNACINIEVGEEIKLPEPKREGGMPLYEALNLRKTLRNFDPSKKVTLKLAYGDNESVNPGSIFVKVPQIIVEYIPKE